MVGLRRRLPQHLPDVGDPHPDPPVGERAVGAGHPAGPEPVHQQRLDLDHVDLLHARVGEQGGQEAAQPQPADQDPPRPGVVAAHHLGEQPLGGGLGGVHEEHAVHDQLVDGWVPVGPAAEHHLPEDAVGAPEDLRRLGHQPVVGGWW